MSSGGGVMLVLVPQALVDSRYGSEKHALKIVSRIVCGHLKECHDFRAKYHLKGKPSDPRTIFGSWINIEGKILKNICGRYNGAYRAAEGHLGSFVLPEHQVGRLNAICDETEWPDDAKRRVAELYAGTWWSKVDDFGRYHTPFTNLPKGIRGEVRCAGKPVVGYDFANFQPALLTLHERAGYNVHIPDQEREIYFQQCRAGKIYEYVAGRCPVPTTRIEAKNDFLKMLNMENKSMKEMSLYSVFAESFPTYADLVMIIKRDDHRAMARFLQGTEAAVMFGGVVRSFMARTTAPFFTVHDAIYTTNDQKYILRDVLNEQIKILDIPTVVEEERESLPPTTPPPTNVGMKVSSGYQSNLI